MTAHLFIQEPKVIILEEINNLNNLLEPINNNLNNLNIVNPQDEIFFYILEQIHSDSLFLYLKKHMNENLAMFIYQIIYTIQLSLIFLLFTLFIIFPMKRI